MKSTKATVDAKGGVRDVERQIEQDGADEPASIETWESFHGQDIEAGVEGEDDNKPGGRQQEL